MPLYDFVCGKCGHAFEALVMGGGQPVCPKCRSTELVKQMSTFAARTGGGGGAEGGGSKCAGCTGRSCRTCR
jgi:putative FmdB family regulatory protein